MRAPKDIIEFVLVLIKKSIMCSNPSRHPPTLKLQGIPQDERNQAGTKLFIK